MIEESKKREELNIENIEKKTKSSELDKGKLKEHTEEYEYEIEWGTYGRGRYPKSYRINNNGIFRVVLKPTENGDTFEMKDVLWKWNDFKILRVIKDNTSERPQKLYEFRFQNEEYPPSSFEAMKREVGKYSCESSRDKQLFGILIREYEKDVKKAIAKNICGFTKEGWILPPEYYINFVKGIQTEKAKRIEKMNNLKIEQEIAKEYMRELYKSIGIEHKGVILSYAIIHPFFHALKGETNLVPFLSLDSPRSDTGQTSIQRLITMKIWDVTENILNSSNIRSESRFNNYFSTSTFGLPIDDCEDLEDNLKDIIKSSITGPNRNQKQNTDWTLAINKELCTPMILSWNHIPKMFEDLKVLSRGINIPLNKVFKAGTKEEKDFQKIKSQIPKGYIGKYIIERTKSWDIKNLQKRYQSIEFHLKNKRIRFGTIYKLIMLGKILIKEFFDLDLDISGDLLELIKDTRKAGSKEVLTVFLDQIKGSPEENRWMYEEVKRKCYRDEFGVLYTTNNLKDLVRRTGRQMHLTDLYERLKLEYPEIGEYEIKVYKKGEISYYGMFVPDKVIREDDKTYSNMEIYEKIRQLIHSIWKNDNSTIFEYGDFAESLIAEGKDEGIIKKIVKEMVENKALNKIENKKYELDNKLRKDFGIKE